MRRRAFLQISLPFLLAPSLLCSTPRKEMKFDKALVFDGFEEPMTLRWTEKDFFELKSGDVFKLIDERSKRIRDEGTHHEVCIAESDPYWEGDLPAIVCEPVCLEIKAPRFALITHFQGGDPLQSIFEIARY